MSEAAQATTIRMYASIRDQLASEITAGVYPAGALLPSIREIMERWEVSTTTARKVLDELAAAGYARKEGTRGAISTGGPQPGPAPSAGEPARKAPPRAAVPGRRLSACSHQSRLTGASARILITGSPRLMSARSNRPPMLPSRSGSLILRGR